MSGSGPRDAGNGSGSIRIKNLRRDYGEHTCLAGVDLDVAPGEFLTLLGPSGSGKSTLLHLIAGLTEPTSGHIYVDDEDVTQVPAQKRNIGLVFQSYALFPHLSARENIEFPLTVNKDRNAAERKARVNEILDLVHLIPQADRRPTQLSGGQQQRVAVGRALSASPRVLLLDEPLGALDRKLRHQLGRDLRRIQQETSVTAVYVTHDQEEAFLMSDRIAIMGEGRLQQIGTPEEIYHHPANPFVASFIGEINFFDVTRSDNGSRQLLPVGVGGYTATGFDITSAVAVAAIAEPIIGVRPESVVVLDTAREVSEKGLVYLGQGHLSDRVFQGNVINLTVDLSDGKPVRALDYSGTHAFTVGDQVHLGVQPERVIILDAAQH